MRDFSVLHGGQPQRNLQAKTDLLLRVVLDLALEKPLRWRAWVPLSADIPDICGSLEGMGLHLDFTPTH